MNEIFQKHCRQPSLLGNAGVKPSETIIDMIRRVPHCFEQLDFICSPLDTPQGLGRGYFFSLYDH